MIYRMGIYWEKINLRSKTQKNLPAPGTECLLVWIDKGEHCATMKYSESGNFVRGSTIIKAKTGMLWCSTDTFLNALAAPYH